MSHVHIGCTHFSCHAFSTGVRSIDRNVNYKLEASSYESGDFRNHVKHIDYKQVLSQQNCNVGY